MLDKLSPAARAQVQEQLKKPEPKGSGSSSEPYNKFGVSPKVDRTDTDGTVYASKLELRLGRQLKLLLGPGRIKEQVPFELFPKQVGPSGKKYQNASYRADFVVDGIHVLDVKGRPDPLYIFKKKAMLHIHKVEIIELRNLKDVAQFVASLPPPK